MKDTLAAITAHREARGWTEYHLAEMADLPQSTISSWYRKNAMPSLSSLKKICKAFGITLSQLFAEGQEPVTLTDSQHALLERWSRLKPEQQEALITLIDRM
ncbi:MAG: helix-turn-helix transcriptional regulator [Ruminiclostridium sp.]|nr:helix-turn-helix transcriptional regulator [Ruminiclostridium sp.]